MRLGYHREAVTPVIVHDRHQNRMIGWMRATVIGQIVQERIAAAIKSGPLNT